MLPFTSRKNPIIGIDISSTSVKVLELSHSGSGYRVEHYGVEPLAANCITEKVISDVDAVGDSIRKVIKRTGSKAKKCTLAVAGSAVITKVITMPSSLSDQEMEGYYDIEKYVVDPQSAYKRLGGGSLKLEQQYTLKELAAWREKMAQDRDIPRTWILKDDSLFDLAIQRPNSEQEVRDMHVFGKKSVNYLAKQAARLIESVQVGDEPLWKKVIPLDKNDKAFCSKMMKQLGKLAEASNLAQGLLATRKDIEGLYRYRESSKLLKGWRKEVVGEPLLEFLKAS